MLDSIQDPQNLGTLLRTAEACGVHGVVLPYRHGVGVTPAVVRVSSGASEHLLVARENLAQSVERLKEEGVTVLGLDMDPSASSLAATDLRGPLALVVGGEGAGLRRLVRESCSGLVRLPMRGRVESLNAAVAGSLALYAAWAQRGYAGASIDAPGKS
jgi:23S rRNA (guanosine2251-2'-O)-methyltransferase